MTKFDEIVMRAPLLIILAPLILGTILLILYRNILGIVLVLVGAIFLVVCLMKVPNDPVHFAVVTIWGERKEKTKREGLRLRANFLPFMLDLLLINAEKRNEDVQPKDVKSKEFAGIGMQISYTYTPDEENAIEFINSGKDKGVKNILDDVIEEAARRWAVKIGWKNCLGAEQEATEELLDKVLGVKDKKAIVNLRRANGKIKMPALGIIINRFNVGTIEIKGKLGQLIEKIAMEAVDREAEKIELDHVAARINELLKIKGMSLEAAVEIVQTERGKIKKHVQEIKGLGNGAAIPLVQIGTGAGAEKTRNHGENEEDEERRRKKNRTPQERIEDFAATWRE